MTLLKSAFSAWYTAPTTAVAGGDPALQSRSLAMSLNARKLMAGFWVVLLVQRPSRVDHFPAHPHGGLRHQPPVSTAPLTGWPPSSPPVLASPLACQPAASPATPFFAPRSPPYQACHGPPSHCRPGGPRQRCPELDSAYNDQAHWFHPCMTLSSRRLSKLHQSDPNHLHAWHY